MAPTDFDNFDAESRGNPRAVVGTGGPASLGNRSDAFDGQSSALGNVLDRQARQLEQMLDRFHAFSLPTNRHQSKRDRVRGSGTHLKFSALGATVE